jgi:hypothetical protein
MEPNPYEAPRLADENDASRPDRREKTLKRLSRIGIALLVVSPFLYIAGIMLVLSADNMRPGKAERRTQIGEVVWSSGTAAFWTGLGLMFLLFFFPPPPSKE